MDEIISEKIKRMSGWMSGEKQAPVTLTYFPTNKCNLNCIFCWRQNPHEKKKIQDEKKQLLSKKRALTLVKESKEFGVREWLIMGGGEPLYRIELTYPLMISIKRNGMRGDIFTNGTSFNERIIRDLISVGWDFIHFSIEGPDAESNDFIRGKGSWVKALNNVRLFKHLKKKSKKDKPVLIMRSTLNHINYSKLTSMVEFAEQNGFSVLELNEVETDNRPVINFKEILLTFGDRENLEKNLELAEKMADQKGIILIKNLCTSKKRSAVKKNRLLSYCLLPFTDLVVRPNGSIHACCLGSEQFGNIKENKLEEIWFGDNFDKKRKELREFNLDDICKKCIVYLDANRITLNEEMLKLSRQK